jgi:hypothetical protein
MWAMTQRERTDVRERTVDRTKLTSAFKAMRKAGLIARQNFMCCMNCGCTAIAGEYDAMTPERKDAVRGYVFYHKQDTERMNEFGELVLRFGTVRENPAFTATHVANLAVAKLKNAGLAVEWCGDEGTCIVVYGDKS